MLCSSYSQEEIDLKNKLRDMTPLKDGDEVLFEGKKYIVVVKGSYCDLGLLVTKEAYKIRLEKRAERELFFETRRQLKSKIENKELDACTPEELDKLWEVANYTERQALYVEYVNQGMYISEEMARIYAIKEGV